MTVDTVADSLNGLTVHSDQDTQAIQLSGVWQPPTTLNYDDLQAAREEYKNKLSSADLGIEDEDPQIEENLFGQRPKGAGAALDALDLEVEVIGAEIQPIKEVSVRHQVTHT